MYTDPDFWFTDQLTKAELATTRGALRRYLPPVCDFAWMVQACCGVCIPGWSAKILFFSMCATSLTVSLGARVYFGPT